MPDRYGMRVHAGDPDYFPGDYPARDGLLDNALAVVERAPQTRSLIHCPDLDPADLACALTDAQTRMARLQVLHDARADLLDAYRVRAVEAEAKVGRFEALAERWESYREVTGSDPDAVRRRHESAADIRAALSPRAEP